MTTIRSSLPSRLRQLLHGESSASPHLKLNSDPPPKVKAFIEKVIQSPLQDIAIPLSGFRWQYNKGNFHHWRPLFLHFETYFKTYVSCRRDLLLSDNILDDDTAFPKHDILQILRVMQIILENCHNKSAFPGLEHFKLLLASTDPDILIATLEVLYALVKINPCKLRSNGKLIGCGSLNNYLLTLAQGWGSKEEGLGLYSCIVANENTQEEGLSLFPPDVQNETRESVSQLGSTLYFELHGIDSDATRCTRDTRSSNSSLVLIPNLHMRKEDDLLLMKQCLEQHTVPQKQRFSLLTRIRYAHAFRAPRICRLFSRISLFAFMVLVQSDDANDELVSFFAAEPEYTNELVRIVRSDDIVPANIRTLAMLALGAQLAAHSSSHERARILSGSSINFTGGNRTILLNVLQRAIMLLNSASDPSSLAFVEALLQFYLLHVVSSSNSGTLIRGSGMVPTFLPLLKDPDPTHMYLVCLAVKTLKKLVDCSHSAATLFKDLGGVDLLASRLQVEVQSVICPAGENGSIFVDQVPDGNDVQLTSQKRLIKNILKALVSATFASVHSTRSQNPQENPLPATLSTIFNNVEKFGGEIYFSAVNVMSETLHKDPTCFPALDELGLPDAFLNSVVSGVFPSSKALICIPNGIGAICLNSKGLEAVKEMSALRFLIDIFTTKKYVFAMNSAVVTLANNIEELLRHVSSLRSIGADILIEIVDKVSLLMDENLRKSSRKQDGGSEMETDSHDVQKENSCSIAGPVSTPETVSDDQFIQLCLFHMMVLVQRTLENTETCRLFVERSGIEALMKLILRPNIAQPSEGMSIAMHSTLIFKTFSQHHSAALARAYCTGLRDQLKSALNGFAAVSGSLLLDSGVSSDSALFYSLFLIEFLLFLAASKDNRWVTALLTEFGSDSKDVLEDIGHLHREVLWQTALLDDAKVEVESDGTGPTGPITGLQNVGLDIAETVEQRFNSFRNLLDPFLRRRTSGWSVDGQIFDLINLYHDLMRTNGLQQRLRADGPEPNPASHQQPDGFNSSESGEALVNKDDKQKSCYLSCYDMLKSLSLHITNMFLELGKAMLAPSRRRDDVVSVAPSSKTVTSCFASIALEHMNFGGHVNSSSSEAMISTKCRYFGKVIDFVDAIILEKPESCNPILLNCLYTHGVIHSVLTTFEATNQLLFAVNRAGNSSMETDDVNLGKNACPESDNLWIYGPLASYAKFMDHLVTSSFILSPSTKHLLAQPLMTTGDIPFPGDDKKFVKSLQSMVLKVVLPVWNHPQFPDCSYDFISTVVSIVRHIYSGIEVRSGSNSTARLSGPPPNESSISTIAEMGFSRARAEEALRQVGTNSVELAMEWLFTHPEESHEDDELARALAMSLGNSTSEVKDVVPNESEHHLEEDKVELPPIEELLSCCVKLMTMKDEIAFPIHELLLMMCTQKEGEYRSSVISFLVDQVQLCSSFDSGSNASLSGLFHVLALILHEDALARDAAFEKGFVKVSIDLLSKWDCFSSKAGQYLVPKWVTASFLSIDRMLVTEQKLSPEVIEQLKKDFVLNGQSSIAIDEDKQCKLYSVLGCVKCLEANDQKRIVDIVCNSMKNKMPAEAMHAALQLCSTITKHHSVAIYFLDSGGLPLLLSLPKTSLFPGYDNISASIIRHILEDPQTLQQAMESEIRHSFVTAPNRHPNGKLNPRNFLLNLSSAISRDPVVFMQAVQSVCQVEMTGDRPYIVLLKDRDKDKQKDKVKDKEKSLDKDRPVSNDGKMSPVSGGQGKPVDSNFRSYKVHRKAPQSFVNVVEFLLDLVLDYLPQQKDETTNGLPGSPSVGGMDIDATVSMKGKGKAVASPSGTHTDNDQEAFTSLAKVVFILKTLTEFLLSYGPTINVLLRKDNEVSSRAISGNCACGVFHHILKKFLPCSKSSKKENKKDGDWMSKLATRASRFMAAASARSSEARRRIFMYINSSFNNFVDSSTGFKEPSSEIQAFIDLLNDALAARTPAGLSVSAEASSTFIDVGLVRSLTRVLKALDLDHMDSPKFAAAIIKALEFVTKEHIRSSSSNAERAGNSTKDSDQNQLERVENIRDISQRMEVTPHSVAVDHVEPFSIEESYGRSEPIPDDMDHDQVFDGDFTAGEDDYMHETSDARELDNGVSSVGIRFEIQSHGQENDGDDDADMSGDDGDDVDEDEDDEHNDLEDDVHHLQHPDTDQDDHEIDDDEFEEEVLEEEEDEDDEDEVLFRLEDGVNGFNILENIEVLGRNSTFSSETFHVMPLEVFGSRNEGRTTSIYSLLGRTGSNATPSAHPLLVEPSPSRRASSRLAESSGSVAVPDRSSESSSSHLEGIFRSLRNGRHHGHRINLWVDDNPQSSGINASSNHGLEELLLSVLNRSSPEKSPNKDKISAQNGENSHEMAEDGVRSQRAGENNGNTENNLICAAENNVSPVLVTEVQTQQTVPGTLNVNSRSAEMHIEHVDATVRDTEAVSQGSSGSGATLGESLRSLDVEIGSADGHDDVGERQVGAERVQLADVQAARSRRANVSFGNSILPSGTELPLFSVSEGSENPSGDSEQGGPTQEHANGNADPGSIDPAFLDALPEELRAEVLSAQQGQVAQPVNPEPPNAGDIDPEFLAALPPDIRAEVLAQQQTQRIHQSQELDGQPVEMDTVSIIATFPSELREEVLLTSSDAILANLTPALVAEANMLRERFANRYNHSLISMYPRSRRGESSRRGDGISSSLDRAGGRIPSHRSLGGKPIEAEGAPLVDSEGLKSLIRLLRVFQPLYKGQLQRLLLNLCAHNEVRVALVKIMLDMLMFDTRKSVSDSFHGDMEEPPYRLYACQSHVMCSRPQFVDGIPPLVSRRVLETLAYLARNHPYVANILLHLRICLPFQQEQEKARGKRVMVIREDKLGDTHNHELASIVLLLRLLNLPLYLRSVAHLEQLLSLLEVIIDNAGSKDASDSKPGTQSEELPSDPGTAPSEEVINSDSNAVSTSDKAMLSSRSDDSSQPQIFDQSTEIDSQNILLNLPQSELQLLCSFLAREGLSDNAYVLVAEVLKKLVSIVPSHSRLFIFELAKCVQGLTKSAIDELRAFWESVKSRLGLAASVGASVLRVLQALSSLVTSLDLKAINDHDIILSQIFEINSVLDPLWLELSTCITKIECSDSSSPGNGTSSTASGATPPLPAGAQNILPYIESFFVVCEKLHPVQSAANSDSGIVAVSDTEDITAVSPAVHQKTAGEKNIAFIRFSDKHRKLLNGFIRQNPGLLEKSFSLILKVPRLIDFDNKRSYFKSKIKHQHDHHHSSLRISVRRAYVLEDSYNQLRMRSSQDLKGRLTVHFQGEEGIDAGGLTREWYQLLSRVIFDKGALLFTTVGNDSTFQPNPNSVYQTEHLSYFKFVGRVVGKALFDGQLLDVHFTRSFYKHILGVKVTYHDIEAIDPDYFKNLKWMLENDITDVLDLTFSIDADEEKLILYERTEVTDYELIPGGRNTKVTEENKYKYVDLVAEHRLTTAIRPQINAFLEGFSELVSRDLISIFNDKELELLISGLPDVDLDDMRANTEYSGYSTGSPVIQWFWEVAYGFSKEDKARLVQFVTGTSKVPLEGFSALQGISGAQKFQIHKAYGSPDHLPSAHTCFNQLDVPEYPSKQHLEERLLLAIHEANEGFGFG